MRIGIVYDAIYPFMTGGLERRNYELGRRLTQRHEVHLIGWQYWQGGPEMVYEGMRLRGVGRPVSFYDAQGRRTFREAASFALRVIPLLARERFDIVDCASIPYTSVLSTRIAAFRSPLVVTWAEYMGRRWQEYLGPRAFAAAAVESACAHVGRMRIAISEFTAARLPGKQPTVVVPNGLNHAEIEAAPPAVDAPDVLFVGRLVPHKRVDMLLEALSLLPPPYTLGIVGLGPGEGRLREIASELAVSDRVRFYGRLESTEAVYGLMKGARVFVQTSEQEGQSIAVMEAMACGSPPVVVKAPDSAATELVSSGVDGIVCDGMPKALSEAMGVLLCDESLRRRLSSNASLSARRYDWQDAAERLERVYLEVSRPTTASVRG